MTDTIEATTTDSPEMMTIHASNVTGSSAIEVSFQRSMPAQAVADSLASMMHLPRDVPWAIRDDSSATYLDDKPIGEQLAPGAKVTISPKTHLG
ncbi:MAG: hypothetical protein ACE5F1_02305 [Planctomycetota bacterium]